MRFTRILGIISASAIALTALAAPVDAGQLPAPGFMYAEADGSPMRWDPCIPHSYLVNTGGLPTTALTAVRGAMAQISKLTGIPWTFAGTTTEQVTDDRIDSSTFVREDLGASMLISFQSPSEGATAIGSQIALPGLDIVPGSLWDWLDSGYLILSPSAYASVPPKLRPAYLFQQLLMTVGIQATSTPGQLQVRELSAPLVVPRRILQALRQVGARQGCGKPPSAPTNFAIHPETGSISWESQPASDALINVIGAYSGEVVADNGSSMVIESALGDVDVLSLLNESGPTTLNLTVYAVSVTGRTSAVSHVTMVYPG